MSILGISNYIDSIDNTDKLLYLTGGGVIMYVFNALEVKARHILTLAVVIILVLYRNDKIISKSIGTNRELELKLKLLSNEEPLYFHYDPDMINLFFSVKDYRKFNKDSYEKAIKTTDNVLHIRSDIEKGIKNNVRSFEIAQMMASRSLNYMQSFIISLPVVKVLHDKHYAVLNRHHILLKRNLDYMYKKCKDATVDIDITTKFITDYNGEKPYNPNMYKLNYRQFELFE
jgi:hypothetical protein